MALRLLLRVRNFVAKKLGVCPFCMRTSAWGAVLSWCLAAVGHLAFDVPLITWLLTAAASAFSLLFIAHLVTYAIRSGIEAHRHRRIVQLSDGFTISDPTRRDFLKVMAKATAYALAISFLGSMPGRAQAQACDGTNPPPVGDSTINDATFGTEAAAQAYLDKEMLQLCDRACQQRGCPQGEGKLCVQNDKKKPIGPKVKPAGKNFKVGGKVKQCTCSCDECAGDHRIPDTSTGQKGEIDPTMGSGGPKPTKQEAIDAANADARARCDELCKRFKNCKTPTPKCKYHSSSNQAPKSWQDDNGMWHATAKVANCNCSCQA
jgi:hypothetical protein